MSISHLATSRLAKDEELEVVAPDIHLCSGCQEPITDEVLLQAGDHSQWHSRCLKCHICQTALGTHTESNTCYIKDGIPYCREDYKQQFPVQCAGCRLVLQSSDLVMKIKTKLYHTTCFRCKICFKVLLPGNQFALKDSSDIVCALHLTTNRSAEMGEVQTIMLTDNCNDQLKSKANIKATRVRTVLNEKQLSTLKACYAANPRPDAIMKEQLVELTGLSPRVIRVWFQNKRCKDKKRCIAGLSSRIQINESKEMAATNLFNNNGFVSSDTYSQEIESFLWNHASSSTWLNQASPFSISWSTMQQNFSSQPHKDDVTSDT